MIAQNADRTKSDSSSKAKQPPAAHSMGLTGRLAAATAILVAVPALINSGYDIYATIMKLPRSEAERTNTELFKKYFRKEPVVVMPIPIKSTFGVLDATFAVYEEGDIHVEYGGQTQWFSLPKPPKTKISSTFSLVGVAHAAPIMIRPQAQPVPRSLLSQSNALSGNALVRTRLYGDGSYQKDHLDLRTGAILRTETGLVPKTSLPLPKAPSQRIFANSIDLETLLRESAASAPK